MRKQVVEYKNQVEMMIVGYIKMRMFMSVSHNFQGFLMNLNMESWRLM